MKKRFLALLLSALIVLACGCSVNGDRIRIGTAGLGGIYNEFGTALAQVATDDDSINIDVKTTTGSAANLRLMSQGYLEMAIAQADIINDAYNGKGTFSSSGEYKGYSAVAGLYTEACQIVVRNDSGIKTVDDLLGKTVSVGEDESGTEQNASQILSAYGLTSDMINAVNLEYADAAKQLDSKKIDAFFCTSGINATVIDELSKQCGIRLLEVSGKPAEKLKTAYKFYTDYIIPKNTYEGQTSEIKTLGLKSVLLASDKLSEEKVEAITKMLFENADKMQYTVSATLELDEQTAVSGITIPFHKGAAAYYKSKNITVSTEQ